MAELSKTAKASMGQQIAKPDPFDTDEKKIKKLLEMRDPALGLLFVSRMDFVDALIRAYKQQQETIQSFTEVR